MSHARFSFVIRLAGGLAVSAVRPCLAATDAAQYTHLLDSTRYDNRHGKELVIPSTAQHVLGPSLSPHSCLSFPCNAYLHDDE